MKTTQTWAGLFGLLVVGCSGARASDVLTSPFADLAADAGDDGGDGGSSFLGDDGGAAADATPDAAPDAVDEAAAEASSGDDDACADDAMWSADAATDTCAPVTCAWRGVTCGPTADGCGITLDCGTCADGWSCSSGHCIPDTVEAGSHYCPSGNDYVVAYDHAVAAGDILFCSQTGECPPGDCCQNGPDGPLCLLTL